MYLDKSAFRKGFKDAFPVFISYFAVALAIGLNAVNAVDVVGAVLSADECTPVVFCDDSEVLADIPRGTPVRIYINGELSFVYYYNIIIFIIIYSDGHTKSYTSPIVS